ncbi:MAG TPA: efflux RND transporter periplasmic adaptor subunit [Hyphomicrobiaceae bacterium]|jgi:RND family efflux transporter MFP subunit|nr:efflux RND transporter periplasmic adaptor subunit [Hyphomicrobiaceae bacterium]
MLRKLIIAVVVLLAAVGVALGLIMQPAPKRAPQASADAAPAAPVTVVRVERAHFAETVLVTGSLAAREEVLVGPEVEGLRVTEVLADEGMRVKKGDVLARLVADTLEAQLAQNDAALARAEAASAQARSGIVQAEARLLEANNAFARAKPLRAAGHMPESAFDQREQAARTAEAQLLAAREGLKVAEAEKGQVEAQRRELLWRRGRTEVIAPADGVVSRRMARIGGFAAGSAEPMFRIVAQGEVELEAEIPETRLAAVRVGQPARVEVAGAGEVSGSVRLVSPEVDKATRLGRVRIHLGDNPSLRVGAFARGSIETAVGEGLAVPLAAVLFGADGPVAQLIRDNRVETRKVQIGLSTGGMIEVRAGLSEGDLVVARSGTFLRDGDLVRPIPARTS